MHPRLRLIAALVLVVGVLQSRAAAAQSEQAPDPAIEASPPTQTPTPNLTFVSSGTQQWVQLQSPTHHHVCLTPCALAVPEGTYELVAGGPGLRSTRTDITAFGWPQTLQIRASTRAGIVGGALMITFGTATVLTAGLHGINVLGSGPMDATNRLFGTMLVVVGTTIGLPLLIGGIALVHHHRVGVEPLRSSPPSLARWTPVFTPLVTPQFAGMTLSMRW